MDDVKPIRRISIETPPAPDIGRGTKIVDADTGAQIHGVRRAFVDIPVDDIVTVALELVSADCRAMGKGDFLMTHPDDGGPPKSVEFIRFADGTEWHAVKPREPVDVSSIGQDDPTRRFV